MKLFKYSVSLTLSFIMASSYADDVDIYLSEDIQIDPPNVLFILDTSGSMNFDSVNTGSWYPQTNETRMDVLRESLFSTLDKTKNVNIGLMRFSSNGNGGFLSKKIDDIDNVKSSIKSQVNSFDSYGGTPISETLYEAYQYFYGKYANYSINNSTFFTNTSSYYWDSGYNTYARQQGKIDTNSYNNSQKYISPITDQCQSNNIILFTDGEASADTGRDSSIRSLISNANLDNSLFNSSKGLSRNCSGNGQCAEELALYMKEVPHTIKDENGNDVKARPIKTYTIGGFFADSSPTIQYLKNLAEAGGGEFKKANDASSLSDVLKDTFEQISSDTVSYSAPALSINAFNSFEHSEFIYFSVFEPNTKAQWNGNLKKYRLSSTGDILDRVGSKAVVNDTGLFSATSKSFWSTDIDGNTVTKGGASANFPASRSIYTYLHDIDDPKHPSSTISLSTIKTSDNKIHSGNSLIKNTDIHLDISNTGISRNTLLDWIEGKNHNYMSDALHSNALILNYGSKQGNSKTSRPVIFTATNAGYLHAIDADTGEEEYAFIPQQLIKNQQVLYRNRDSKKKLYGLDGPITSWFHDFNNDNLIYNGSSVQVSREATNSSSALTTNQEFYQIYLGMRRGGHSYFSLDATYRDNPKLAWQINGNDPELDTTPGFEELGQTWSEMTLGQIIHNNKVTPVLFFTGGYDEYYDPKDDGTTNPFSPSINSANKEVINGNALYIVNARTGQLLWKATGRQKPEAVNGAIVQYIPQMTDAFPANVATLDIDNDGLTDVFYATDIKGKIWRFNIYTTFDKSTPPKPIKTEITNYEFANLAASSNPSGSSKRYFYHAPNVTKVSTKYGSYLAVSIVSGSNADPLDTDQTNYFFTLRDKNLVAKIPANQTVLTHSQLKNVTNYDYTEEAGADPSSLSQSQLEELEKKYEELTTAPGLVFQLKDSGEKGLAKPLIFGEAVLFTTFAPKDRSSSSTTSGPKQCTGAVDLGTGRLYRFSLLTGGSLIKDDKSFVPRSTELKREDIPVTPTVIFPPGDGDGSSSGCQRGPLIFVGTELIGQNKCTQSTQKLQWLEK